MTHRIKTPKSEHRNFFAEWNQRDKNFTAEDEHEHSFQVPAIAAAILNKGLDIVTSDRFSR